MEEKRITIKDIAEKAEVSIGSVHCALSQKSGVSEETRMRIIKIAHEMGYRPNAAAASLKRKTLRIAAAFPGPTEQSRYYFSFVWEGIRDWMHSLSDMNVELIEVPYYIGANSQANELADLLDNTQVDGLLSTGHTDARGAAALQSFIRRGIPVALVGDDLPQSDRLCCVQPNYSMVGRTIAELLMRQIPSESGILLCVGDVMMSSHYLMVQGFEEYLSENDCKNPIYKVHATGNKKDGYERIARELTQRNNLAACFSVNARDSVQLGQALEDTGKAGKIAAVGSDLFEENVQFLKEGVFTNLIYKKPYSQANTAAKYLTDYLLKGLRPPQEIMYVGSEVVFQSSLPMYDNGLFRQLR